MKRMNKRVLTSKQAISLALIKEMNTGLARVQDRLHLVAPVAILAVASVVVPVAIQVAVPVILLQKTIMLIMRVLFTSITNQRNLQLNQEAESVRVMQQPGKIMLLRN